VVAGVGMRPRRWVSLPIAIAPVIIDVADRMLSVNRR
jgi:hypothetical protein